MKKVLACIASIFAFLFVFSGEIQATEYDGNLGYDYSSSSTNFYFYIDDENISYIEIHIEGLEQGYKLLKDDSGIYVVNVEGNLKDKEYYYNVCYSDSTCKDTYDIFAPSLNTSGNKNVILDKNLLVNETLANSVTIETTTFNKSIYAIEVDKFVENINIAVSSEHPLEYSIFEKLIADTTYSSSKIGFSYLSGLGIKFVEMGDLYDDNNYYSPNQEYSSKLSNYSANTELKNVVVGYKNAKMNIVLRTNFLIPSNDFKSSLEMISPDYIVDGKINLNNPMMKRYIENVYKHWLQEYKIDGFYIEDASLYGTEFLNSLIVNLKEINEDVLIYTNSDNAGEYHTSNNLQDVLLGNLNNNSNEGILNGNYTEDNFQKLVNSMFSGYYQSLDKYDSATKVINNFGSFNGLDVYSKLKIIAGLATRESVISNKVKLALYSVFASAGIPRLVAGNEFLNTTIIPTSEIETTPALHMSCNNSKTICYAINDYKTINWEILESNGSDVATMMRYRTQYTYQYPSRNSMYNAKDIYYDTDVAKSGLLYLSIHYQARENGDPERTILLINYSDSKVDVSKISDKNYVNISPLNGKITGDDSNTSIYEFTFFTFTEVRNKKLANWAYILIAIGLMIIVFGTRAVLIKLLKNKHGIDYSEYVKQQKEQSKKNRKNKIKVKEPSVFETFLGDEPLFKQRAEERKKKKEEEKAAKKAKQTENSSQNPEAKEAVDEEKVQRNNEEKK